MKKENNLDVATMFHKDPVLYGANLGDEQTLVSILTDNTWMRKLIEYRLMPKEISTKSKSV
jgi:hypothetical protein